MRLETDGNSNEIELDGVTATSIALCSHQFSEHVLPLSASDVNLYSLLSTYGRFPFETMSSHLKLIGYFGLWKPCTTRSLLQHPPLSVPFSSSVRF